MVSRPLRIGFIRVVLSIGAAMIWPGCGQEKSVEPDAGLSAGVGGGNPTSSGAAGDPGQPAGGVAGTGDQPRTGAAGQPGAAGSGTASTGAGGTGAAGGVAGGAGTSISCSDVFDQGALQSYQIEISDAEWAKLAGEFQDVNAVLAGHPPQTFHPITFHRGGETAASAAIRLKGQSSWVDTVMFDAKPKMQFVVSFNETDPKGSFHGLGKLEFDMPRADWSFLNERVANAWLRQSGILAPCANSAKLTINGVYYGLYTTEETKGDRLLKEFFPGNSSGDFFKAGLDPQHSDLNPNWMRQLQFWNATNITAVSQIVDLPNSLLTWAAEAILNDSDGYYGGSHNFYLYDQGAAGYVFLPTDVDTTLGWMTTFTALGYRQHPIFWWSMRPFPQPPGQHYLIVMNDPTWRSRYVDAVATQLRKWDVAQVQGWIDAWSVQIAEAVNADPHKWATSEQFKMAIAATRDMVSKRPAYLQSFVACERGQPADDADHDGVVWCNDCADNDPSVHPGALEVCGNKVDDDCNGVADENCPGEQPRYPGQVDVDGGPSIPGNGAPDAGAAGG